MSNKPLNQYVLITPDNGVTKITGEYPHDLVAKLCSMYKSIIVIDQHTNTIKFVEKVMDNPEALDVRTVKEVSLDPANDATDKVDKQQLNYIASLLSKFRPGKDYGWGIYRITGSRTFNTEELGKIAYATVVASDFGKKAQFILKDGTISFNDIFNTMGITYAIKSKSSVEGMQQTIEQAKQDFNGICFTNLVDFDAKWGHRRNPEGYAKELVDFDENLSDLINNLKEDDILFITADHGNDPTWKGTDHTREMIPVVIYSKSFSNQKDLGTFESFACVGSTIADIYDIDKPSIGKSLLNELK